MKSMLFHRIALSKDKADILEFLNIPQNQQYLEGELEQKLITNLQSFLLELGKGFAFIGRP